MVGGLDPIRGLGSTLQRPRPSATSGAEGSRGDSGRLRSMGQRELLAPHKRIMTLTNSESYARHLLEISGCNDTSGIVLSGSTERPLARFLKDRELDVYDALFDAGNFDVDLHDKLNRPALRILLKADADLYFVRFDFNPDGTVIPVFHGPVEERTPQALEEFISQFYPQRYD